MSSHVHGERTHARFPITRVFALVTTVVVLLCFIIVFLLTPEESRRSFWIDVTLAVAGAALVVLVVHFADRLILLREMSTQVDEVVKETLDERMTRSQWATGVVGIHGSLTEAGLDRLIAEAVDQEICILDTYIPDPIFFTTKMERALKQGCRFKFLVLEPNSEQAKARAEILSDQGLGTNQFQQGTQIYVCTIASVCHAAKAYEQIKMRFYTEPPVFPAYVFRSVGKNSPEQRDRLLFGFYLDKASYGLRHLEVARVGQPLFEMLEGYFDRMWDRNKKGEVDLEQYLKESCPIGFRQDPD